MDLVQRVCELTSSLTGYFLITSTGNYYRTHRQNFLDDSYFTRQENSDAATINCPALFLCATKDIYVRPEVTEVMRKSVSNLTFEEVDAGHWILWEKPGVVNGVLREWFQRQGLVINKGQ
jgi:pimeloyl-ACP methyl ester carboxylesterase